MIPLTLELTPPVGSTAIDAPGEAPNQLFAERHWSRNMDFTRTVWLSSPVDSTRVKAQLEDGILTLKAPKLEDKETVKVPLE